MMNLDNYYIYATGGYYGKVIYRHGILNIMKDGEIKTRESLDYDGRGYNRNDEICLCDVTLNQEKKGKIEYESAFESFVLKGPSLVLSKKIEVYQPQLLEKKQAKFTHTDMYDEVRHIGNISLDYLEFITYPIKVPTKEMNSSEKIIRLENLKYFSKELAIIRRKHKNILIKDIYTGENITSKDVKLLIKDYKKASN